ILFGLCAPLVTRLMLATPPAFIATLAGLAMLRVLQTAFTISFQGRFTLGALVTFLVTVAGIPVFNIGAPFWALIAGTLASLLLDRADWRAARAQPEQPCGSFFPRCYAPPPPLRHSLSRLPFQPPQP